MVKLPEAASCMCCSLQQGMMAVNIIAGLSTIGNMIIMMCTYMMNANTVGKLFGWIVFVHPSAIVLWAFSLLVIPLGIFAIQTPLKAMGWKNIMMWGWFSLLVLMTIAHLVWAAVFIYSCRAFFEGAQAGSILDKIASASNSIETSKTISRIRNHRQLLNDLSIAPMYELLKMFPPLHLIFGFGWWAPFTAIVFLAIPLVIHLFCLYFVYGYMKVINAGGEGDERVPPSKLKWFYKLPESTQREIMSGQINYKVALRDKSYGRISGGESGSDSDSSDDRHLREEKSSRQPLVKPGKHSSHKK